MERSLAPNSNYLHLTSSESGLAGVVPSYSGGTARELHPLPFIYSVYVESDNRKATHTLSTNKHKPNAINKKIAQMNTVNSYHKYDNRGEKQEG